MASFDEVKHCSTFLLTSTGLLMEGPDKTQGLAAWFRRISSGTLRLSIDGRS